MKRVLGIISALFILASPWVLYWTLSQQKIGVAAIMLIGFVQLIYAPTLLPSWLTLFILGVASGAAMIPYTIIKEVNPDEVKGSATGAINFLTFAVTAAIGPQGRIGPASSA